VSIANGTNGFKVGNKNYKFELVQEDNQSVPEQAISIDQKFLRDNIKFILGPSLGTAFTPAFNSIKGQAVMNITPTTGAIPFLGTPDGKYLFDTHMREDGPTGRVVLIVKLLMAEYKPKKVAILLPQDGPGELYVKAFGDNFKAAGVDVVYSEFFPAGNRDFASYIAAMKSKSPDLVVSGYIDAYMTPFLDQAVQAGFTTPVMVAAPGGGLPSLKGKEAQIKNYAFSVATRAVDDPTDAQTAAFRANYKTKFGKDPEQADFWMLSYYDPINMLAKAMQKAGTTTDLDKITAAMKALPALTDGALKSTFDSSNQAVYKPQVALVTSGVVKYANP
jgi:branched-chain amino acid transport system substrate-binding protein